MSPFMQGVVLFFLAISMLYAQPPETIFGAFLFIAVALDVIVMAARRQRRGVRCS